MKRVIKSGKMKPTTITFKCSWCGCVFEADREDYTEHFDRNEHYYNSTCPTCGKTASVYPNSDVLR